MLCVKCNKGVASVGTRASELDDDGDGDGKTNCQALLADDDTCRSTSCTERAHDPITNSA